MKELLLPVLGLQWIAAATTSVDNPLWERLLEKWGIAFVAMLILWRFSVWQAKREQDEKVRRENADKIAQDKRDAEDKLDREERNKLLQNLHDVSAKQLEASESHALKIERLTKDVTTAIVDNGAGMRMLVRTMSIRPCFTPFPVQDSTEKQQQPTPENEQPAS